MVSWEGGTLRALALNAPSPLPRAPLQQRTQRTSSDRGRSGTSGLATYEHSTLLLSGFQTFFSVTRRRVRLDQGSGKSGGRGRAGYPHSHYIRRLARIAHNLTPKPDVKHTWCNQVSTTGISSAARNKNCSIAAVLYR